MLWICGCISSMIVGLNLLCYLCLTPSLNDHPLGPLPFDKPLGWFLYNIACLLAQLRIIFLIVPMLARLVAFLILGRKYRRFWEGAALHVLRIIGDIVNIWLVWQCAVALAVAFPNALGYWFLIAALGTEVIHVIFHKGQMVVSACWQHIPHRAIAQTLFARQLNRWFLARYCAYYVLGDSERVAYMTTVMRQRASQDPELAAKLAYVSTFRIVPQTQYLQGGYVRDVASGEIFIHASWTNDPWLILGQALRRSPWIFDPRYLARPFYYRTGANRLASLCVLSHLRYSPPYALYQFGHEVKAASITLLYHIPRLIGCNIEGMVQEDGTYRFDPLINWLAGFFGYEQRHIRQRPLWNDAEVIAHCRNQGGAANELSPYSIAQRYTYPRKYVEEVLWSQIEHA